MRLLYLSVACIATLGCVSAGRRENQFKNATIPNGQYRLIVNRGNSKCLQVRGDNKRMQEFDCGNQLDQKFNFSVDGSDRYTITSPSLAGRCLDVNEHNNHPDQLLQMYFCESTPYQKWELLPVGGNWYQLQNVVTGQCARVRDFNGGNETWVVQDACNDGEHRDLWRLDPPPQPPVSPPPPVDPCLNPEDYLYGDRDTCEPTGTYFRCQLIIHNRSYRVIEADMHWKNAGTPPNFSTLNVPHVIVPNRQNQDDGSFIVDSQHPMAHNNPKDEFYVTNAHCK